MATPTVSVLMPVHNSATFLRQAVDSILNQTYRDFEFIVVDDGSYDGSGQMLSDYIRIDPRIKVITNEKNSGIVFSLNRGLKKCTGDFIMRMDSDDIALCDRLEKQIKYMEKRSDCAVLGGAIEYIDASGRELGQVRKCSPNSSLLSRNPLLHPTVVIRRAVLVQHGIFYRERYRYAEDYYMWLEVSKFGKLCALDDIVLKYRISNSATRFKHLKRVLWSTIKVKMSAMHNLQIYPTIKDICQLLLEIALLSLPTALIAHLYLAWTFKGKTVAL